TPGGDPTEFVTAAQALPLTALIPEAMPGLSWDRVQYAQIVDLDGGTHDLTQDQLKPAPDNTFDNGLSPSVWAATGGRFPSMKYFRPLTAGDPNDVNVQDFVVAKAPQALTLLLHTSGK